MPGHASFLSLAVAHLLFLSLAVARRLSLTVALAPYYIRKLRHALFLSLAVALAVCVWAGSRAVSFTGSRACYSQQLCVGLSYPLLKAKGYTRIYNLSFSTLVFAPVEFHDGTWSIRGLWWNPTGAKHIIFEEAFVRIRDWPYITKVEIDCCTLFLYYAFSTHNDDVMDTEAYRGERNSLAVEPGAGGWRLAVMDLMDLESLHRSADAKRPL